MALETISQILSPTNATYINGVSAERRFAAAVLANMYQGLVEKDGVGVNDSFVSTNDAEESAQVFVNRIKPVKMQPREMGANKNGGSFSANQHYSQTETVSIEILQVLDDIIIIPRARQDMIKVDLLAEQTKIYSDRLKTILNGATAAAKLIAVYNEDKAGRAVNYQQISASDVTNKLVGQRFIEANSKLDEGDIEHGIDIFPTDTRVAVIKPSYRATLLLAGVLVIGGSNNAQDILAKGTLSKEATARKTEDGYIGEIDNVPVHILSNESLRHCAGFLGLPEAEYTNSGFIGYIASSYANARGVSTSKQTKVVDAQSGQGLILQPYTKFGVVSWYPKGNVVLGTDSTLFNPQSALATLGFTLTNVTFKLKGAGSRLYPLEATPSSVSASGFTLSGVTAKDDFGTDHLIGVYYFVGNAVNTLAGFATGYAGATYKGSLTVGSAVSTTLANNDIINFCALADDGSVAVWNKKVTVG